MSDLDPVQEAMLEADLNGARGPEVQTNAEIWAAENGYELVDVSPDDDEAQVEDPDWEEGQAAYEWGEEPELTAEAQDLADVSSELARLAQIKGRPLTSAEEEWVIDQIPEQGEIPNLAERYGERIKDRSSTEEGQVGAMVEAANDARRKAASGAEQREPLPPADSLESETEEQFSERVSAAVERARAEAQENEPTPVPAGLDTGGDD